MNRVALTVALVSVAGCSSASPGTPTTWSQGMDDLTGEYTNVHTIMHVGEDDWEEATVRDTLAIQQRGETMAFYFALVQTNYHICEMHGAGARTQDGIAAPPESIEFGEETDVCNFRIVTSQDTIRLVDEGNICRRHYCGARAYIDGVVFPRR